MGGNWSLTDQKAIICNRAYSFLTIASACLKYTLNLQVTVSVPKFPLSELL